MPASLAEIREAFSLTSSGGASNLVPKVIDRLLLELQRKWGPMYRAVPRQTWETDEFFFNKRTTLPKAQHSTEAPPTSGTGSVAASNSTYVQSSFPIKHTTTIGDLSKFTVKVASNNGSLFDLELGAHAKSMEWLEETTHIFGSAQATLRTHRPQWDGVDLMIANANKIDAGTALLALKTMDDTVDAVRGVYAQELGMDYFWMMSPKMQSYVNGLHYQQVRYTLPMARMFSRDDNGDPMAPVANSAIDAGVEVQTYRNIPIVVSSWMGNQGTMGTVSTTGNTGTGSSLLAATTYYYRMEAVTRYGLTAASAEASQAPSGNGNNVVLSWTTPTPTDSEGNIIDIIGYRIFRSTTSGAESLYAVCAAYDLSDAAVTSFTDTGLIQNPAATNTLYWATVASSSTNAVSDGYTFPRVQTGTQVTEDIFLIPRDPEILLCPEVNPISTEILANVNLRTRQFGMTSDKTLALRAPAYAAKISRVRCA
jgi:hypothetical protein